MIPQNIFVSPKIEKIMKSKGIFDQFIKVKNNIINGFVFGGSQLKKREPKSKNIWYFRINKQYRVIGKYNDGDFYILSLDTHQ